MKGQWRLTKRGQWVKPVCNGCGAEHPTFVPSAVLGLYDELIYRGWYYESEVTQFVKADAGRAFCPKCLDDVPSCPFMTVKGAASVIGSSAAKLTKDWRDDNGFEPMIKPGKVKLVDKAKLNHWLEARKS